MHIPAYKTAAAELSSNKEQFAAYNSQGHFVVLAGPGSGKTKVLTTKLARFLFEDIEAPRGVACVTYSNECARELRSRLLKLGIQPNRRVFIGTVHSFCLQHVLTPFAKLAGMDISQPFQVATSTEQKRCFARALREVISSDEKPYDWEIRCSVYRRKFIDRQSPEWMNSDTQAAQVISQYENNLRTAGLIDFDDMMLLGLRLIMENKWVRKALQAKFPTLVVDEYQDLGVPLHQLVLSLCFPQDGPFTRLFAVGDPDQSIYGFVGAEPALLRDLTKREDVESVTLKLNYRSRQSIISASEVALGEVRGYQAVNKTEGLIDFHHCDKGIYYQAKLIRDTLIPKMLSDGIAQSLGQIAVLYSTKNEGDSIARCLSMRNIEHIRIDGNAPYSKTPLIRWLEDCAAWCSSKDKKDAPSLRTIIREYHGFNRTMKSEKDRVESTNKLVSALRDNMDGSSSLRKWLNSLDQSFLRSHLLADPTMRDEISSLDNLITETMNGKKLTKWSVSRFGGQGGSPNHLNLMTLHSSKGLEFDAVVLFGMDQGIIPSYRQKTLQSKREARRLFYVGITRARHEVHITYSGWRTTSWGNRFDEGPSEFVLELQSKLNG